MKKVLLLCVLGLGLSFFFQSCSPYYYDRGYYPSRTVYVRPVNPYYAPPPRVYVQRRPHRHYRGRY